MTARIQKLNFKTRLEIFPTTPFHFASTFYKPGHFPSADTKWENNKRWQTMLWQGERLGLLYSAKASRSIPRSLARRGMIFEDGGTFKKPKVVVQVFSAKKINDEFLESLKKELIWRFNLDLNLNEFYRSIGNDPLLSPIIKKFCGLRPMHYGSLYEYLIIDIMLQNCTVKRSVNMLQALFENYGVLLEFDHQKFWSYWEPQVLASASEEKLRALKLGYRAKSLIRVSQSFVNSQIDELSLRQKSAEEQEKTLLSLYGIGPASVGYIMFDAFHHFDYVKNISPWEQKIYTHIFFNKDHEKELVPVSKMLKIFEKWGGWKGLAINYVWENIWWQRHHKHIPWLEKLIRL